MDETNLNFLKLLEPKKYDKKKKKIPLNKLFDMKSKKCPKGKKVCLCHLKNSKKKKKSSY